VYRSPRWKNVLHTMVEKARIFVFDAGKIIMIISLLLWVLSSFGPSGKMDALEQRYAELRSQPGADLQELDKQYQSDHLANSYAGIVGKSIEPAITPLGYDWKIGIALVTSFAAREVFVGTMATLYSVGGDADENDATLRQKMAAATWPDGTKVYSLATGFSLMVFYLLAMQCMSTLAIVKRETKTWKWPLIQLVYMTVLAYGMSFLFYQLLK
jgi:ferrous iron transport protein B